MRDYLIRLGLIDHLVVELDVEREDFRREFRALVDEGDTGQFLSGFEAFSSSRNSYIGHVGQQGFKIRKRVRFFDMNRMKAVAEGRFEEAGQRLLVHCTVSSAAKGVWFMFIFLLLFYLLFIGVFVSSSAWQEQSFFFLPFILVHAAFMFGIPYMMLRRSVRTMKYDLERELHFVAGKAGKRSM